MHDVALGVSDAVDVINDSLDQIFPFIVVEGEVASFKVNQGKFVFFDLKDESSSLGCFMMLFGMKFPLEDGMRVKVLAQPKLTKWGKFSLTVSEVTPVGEGSLKKSFELLKAKLEAEGLFDPARKRPLPVVPVRIGVVSSSGAAGYADFIKILENRWRGLEITLVDVPVQGAGAPDQLIEAVEYLNEQPEPVDVIAVIRGGGSLDDLSSFNHEGLVRVIARSRIPVIVGVGHEVDVSLADLAADRRAATPSNAAELLVPDRFEVIARVHRLAKTAHNGADAAVRVFNEDRQQVIEAIDDALKRFFDDTKKRLAADIRTLRQLSPQAALQRGYSLVKKAGVPVSSRADVIIGDEVNLEFKDGVVGAKITYVD